MGKEGHARDTFYLFDAIDIKVFLSVAISISAYKAYAFGVVICQTYNHLEKGFWHNHLVISDSFMLLLEENGTAYNKDFAILFSPSPA